MELKRCLFVGLLALASVGTAAAKETTQDPTAPHATLDSASHDSSGSADAPGANHDCPVPGNAADSSDGTDGGGGGATSPHPHATHHSSLGWQSLLPGSIQ